MDIVLTWPKKVPYAEYVRELDRAAREDKSILFKVPTLPIKARIGDRCYMVYDGRLRGWSVILYFDDEAQPDGVRPGDTWEKGKYIVRSPVWHELQDLPLVRGFQGFRYADPDWLEIPEVAGRVVHL
jgi:hypothetical protein